MLRIKEFYELEIICHNLTPTKSSYLIEVARKKHQILIKFTTKISFLEIKRSILDIHRI